MNIDKDTILNLLRSNGQVVQAQHEFPDQVDTGQHAALLEKFRLNTAVLIVKFTSGQSGGGIGALLGKVL